MLFSPHFRASRLAYNRAEVPLILLSRWLGPPLPYTLGIVLHHLVNPIRGDRALHRPARVVLHRPEERSSQLQPMPRGFQVVGDELHRPGMQRQVAELPAFAMHPQVQHPAPRVDIPHFERAELLPPQSVVEPHREAIAPRPSGCATGHPSPPRTLGLAATDSLRRGRPALGSPPPADS
jgi:hypothetical protein